MASLFRTSPSCRVSRGLSSLKSLSFIGRTGSADLCASFLFPRSKAKLEASRFGLRVVDLRVLNLFMFSNGAYFASLYLVISWNKAVLSILWPSCPAKAKKTSWPAPGCGSYQVRLVKIAQFQGVCASGLLHLKCSRRFCLLQAWEMDRKQTEAQQMRDGVSFLYRLLVNITPMA